MSEADAVWLVAGGEPGAQRFGQLIQRLRKAKQLSVEGLAAAAGLSVGTIRAIEQARRAPSRESGVRLLRLLLPEDALSVSTNATGGTQGLDPDITFADPESGGHVAVKFRAKTAGDNRRWSSDRPRVRETQAEAVIREFWNDPDRSAQYRQQFRRALSDLNPMFDDLRARAERPADDDAFGRIVRRLATADEFRLHYIDTFLDWWERVHSGTADDHERELLSQVQTLLNSLQTLPVEDVLGEEERAGLQVERTSE